MRAGLDIGGGLIKAAWSKEGGQMIAFMSTADVTADELFKYLSDEGVNELVITGRGRVDLPDRFNIIDCDGHYSALVRGINAILPTIGMSDLAVWWAVDFGISIEYIMHVVSSGRITEFPFPSALGGGYLQGQADLLALPNVMQLADFASRGEAPDILGKDIDNDLGGTVAGSLPLAHFGLVDDTTPVEDICAGHIHVVANSVRRDLMYLQAVVDKVSNSEGVFIPPVIVVGTPTSRLPILRDIIKVHLVGDLNAVL